MRDSFPNYYPKTKEQFRLIWNECLFVPDTNVLLGLYRYTPKTRDELLSILAKISDRLWAPHQVALEYLTRRPDVILTQRSMYEKGKELTRSLRNNAQAEIEKRFTFRHHPFIDKQGIFSKIESTMDEIDKKLDANVKKYSDLPDVDHIWDTITDLLDGRVGPPYSAEELTAIYAQGKERYENEVPPGYEDAKGPDKKEGNRKYGDLVLWFQTIDKAKETERPIILITNDKKEDWWWVAKGRTIGPRPELLNEMMDKANATFHMYDSGQFMFYTREHLDTQVKQQAIDEIREIRKADEERREGIASEELVDMVDSALETLHPREQKVMRFYFGLNDGRTWTEEDIATEFGINADEVDEMIGMALRKLRHPRRSKRLKSVRDSPDQRILLGYRRLLDSLFGW